MVGWFCIHFHCLSNRISSSKKFYLFYIKNLISSILHKKLIFFILYHHFYKTPISIHLLYTIFYINNIFIFFFYKTPTITFTKYPHQSFNPSFFNTKIIYRRATITMYICAITVTLVHLCTILDPLMLVFF